MYPEQSRAGPVPILSFTLNHTSTFSVRSTLFLLCKFKIIWSFTNTSGIK